MDLPESYVHSFIIRIWMEATVAEAHRAAWRGSITHVPSGERRSFEDLDAIDTFIEEYLEGMGVNFGLRHRVKRWFWHSVPSL